MKSRLDATVKSYNFASFPSLYRAMSTSIVEAFCFRNPLINAALHLLCLPFVLELTRLGLKMEERIARDGHLQGASQWLVDIAAQGLHVHQRENVPQEGPLLFVGNHAGLGDAHALWAASPRRDTSVIAYDFGILRGLDEMRPYFILVDRGGAGLRAALRHLRAGGSLLLFPRGEIEADPGLYPQRALESLPQWSSSIDFLARHVPDLTVLPFAVGGVLSRRALRNPLVRLYRDWDRRHFLAATFQMMFPCYRDPVISLRFGRALRGRDATQEAVSEQMAQLLGAVHAEQQSLMKRAP